MRLQGLILFFIMLVPAFGLQAKTCELSISGNDMIQYDKSTLTVAPDCDSVKLTLHHTGKLPVKQMGHNWVLAPGANWKEIAMAGLTAGESRDYIPDDDRIIAHTDLVGGGESTSITFDVSKLDPGDDYQFFCTFPGHYINMNGTFVVQGGS